MGGLRPWCVGLGKNSGGRKKKVARQQRGKKRKKKDNRGTERMAWILSDLLRSEEVGGAVEIRGVGM